MVVMIEDRRVTSFPAELDSMLHVGNYCICCKKTCNQVSSCSRCKVVSYCSRECQKLDFSRHKKEDDCVGIGEIRSNLELMEQMLEANSCLLMQEVMMTFGHEEDTWLGRGEPSFMEMMGLMTRGLVSNTGDPLQVPDTTRPTMDVIAGRFFRLQGTTEYMNALTALNQKVTTVCHRHNTLEAYEEILKIAVEMKRLTHAVHPDMCDREIPKVLFKLHRDDDAIAFIKYWIQWRTKGEGNLRDPLVLLSKKGEWPFPVEEGARFDDIVDEIRGCRFPPGALDSCGEELSFHAPFAVTALFIKGRHICVHRILASKADAFLETERVLPPEIKTRIVSFVTGGDEGVALYEEMMRQATRLMDYIDEAYPHILFGTIFPEELPAPRPGHDGIDDDQAFDIRGFLNTFADSVPAAHTVLDIINERFSDRVAERVAAINLLDE